MKPNFKIIFKYFTVLHLMLVLVGCSPVGPNYTTPDISLPTKWHSNLEKGLTDEQTDPQILSSWWKTLDDPQLSSLIERAIAGNLDLQDAYWRLYQSRATRGIAKADMFPSLDFSGKHTWTRSSGQTGSSETTDLYSTGFDAGWEIDLFGGIRRSIEAANADFQATGEDLRDVLVTLLSEVALNYIEVRSYQAQLQAVNENLDAQQQTFQIVDWQSQADLIDELAVQQARYNLESTRSQIPDLYTGLEEAMNRIAVLLGEPPGEVHEELNQIKPIPVLPVNIAIGVPADMIRRRPDVRKAERQLAAQTARVGVATAELYPKFTLSGSIGLEAVSFHKLANNSTTANNWALSGGPRISWAIFDAGAIRQNIRVQSALQEQSLIEYESAILNAIEEVENALVAYTNEQYKNNNLKNAAEAAQKAAQLAQQKYEAGLTDFSDVLEAQRSQLSFESQLVQSDGVVTSNLIRLYKVLGGGWSSLADEDNVELSGENNEK